MALLGWELLLLVLPLSVGSACFLTPELAVVVSATASDWERGSCRCEVVLLLLLTAAAAFFSRPQEAAPLLFELLHVHDDAVPRGHQVGELGTQAGQRAGQGCAAQRVDDSAQLAAACLGLLKVVLQIMDVLLDIGHGAYDLRFRGAILIPMILSRSRSRSNRCR